MSKSKQEIRRELRAREQALVQKIRIVQRDNKLDALVKRKAGGKYRIGINSRLIEVK